MGIPPNVAVWESRGVMVVMVDHLCLNVSFGPFLIPPQDLRFSEGEPREGSGPELDNLSVLPEFH